MKLSTNPSLLDKESQDSGKYEVLFSVETPVAKAG